MIVEELEEYKKDVKNLSRKYRSLAEDLALVKKILSIKPQERPPFSFRINNLGIETCVIKVKKIACKALKGKGVNSGLRLVYAHFECNSRQVIIERELNKQVEIDNSELVANQDSNSINRLEQVQTLNREEKIVLVELYHKNNKAMEDRKRIIKHFK